MVKLRTLRLDDTLSMFEWMQDESVVGNLRTNFSSKSIDDCIEFIREAENDTHNYHFAITSENDEYLGTCSLKNVNVDGYSAEFGIVIRKKAMGLNISSQAMRVLFEWAKNETCLKLIYWCVDPKNVRALRFYDKNECERIDIMSSKRLYSNAIWGGYSEKEIQKYIWYQIQL